MDSSIIPFKYKKVMVVDDNEIDRYVCERASKQFRLSETIVGMESAVEALHYLNSLKENPLELPELIFLDINMPEMNGFEFLDVYSDLHEVIKRTCIIVMLTSSTNDEDKRRINGNRYVRTYLNKPLTLEKINGL